VPLHLRGAISSDIVPLDVACNLVLGEETGQIIAETPGCPGTAEALSQGDYILTYVDAVEHRAGCKLKAHSKTR